VLEDDGLPLSRNRRMFHEIQPAVPGVAHGPDIIHEVTCYYRRSQSKS
jgi:hypothetical protein